MAKKHRKPKLIDPSKRGSLIVGHYRCGSHFVRALAKYQWDRSQPARACVLHDEWLDAQESSRARLCKLRKSDYHVVILNEPLVKQELMLDPARLDEWHVIRMVHEDKVKWFISYYFYCIFTRENPHVARMTLVPPTNFGADKTGEMWFSRPAVYKGSGTQGHFFDKDTLKYLRSWSKDQSYYFDPERIGSSAGKHLLHHGGARAVYQEIMDLTHDPKPFMFYLAPILTNHMLCQMFPADVELQYDSLAGMANDTVSWLPNDYGDIDFDRIFTHGDVLRQWLERWSGAWPGVFKEKQ